VADAGPCAANAASSAVTLRLSEDTDTSAISSSTGIASTTISSRIPNNHSISSITVLVPRQVPHHLNHALGKRKPSRDHFTRR